MSEKSMPKVTAIITVFNGANFIADSVRSLLNQSLTDIEVLVVNDGSTDTTAAVIDSINDVRLRVIHLPRTGRAASLALACEEARGLYIANLDADDISYSERLAKQSVFLDLNSDYAWVGCGEEQEDNRRNEHHQRIYPQTNQDIRLQCAKCIPYCHSGVMFRKSLINSGINYDSNQPYLIDFEFFLRIAQHHKVANLSEVLVKRYVRGESYFQSQFKTWRQNLRLARFCFLAIWRFGLPIHYFIYPLARVLYPYMPNKLKKYIRSKQGLGETHD
jgi:glycosyltransferase involved in cell wall biosynthesis